MILFRSYSFSGTLALIASISSLTFACTAADAVEAKVKELIDAVNAKVPERL